MSADREDTIQNGAIADAVTIAVIHRPLYETSFLTSYSQIAENIARSFLAGCILAFATSSC